MAFPPSLQYIKFLISKSSDKHFGFSNFDLKVSLMKKVREELGKHALQLGLVIFTTGVITPLFQGKINLYLSTFGILLWASLVSIGIYLLSNDE